ncbi:response regulator [Jannaschia sp. R86511]|uniref:response regulator n=1 Tax=Jannaschia sp. R86511 TaxID=3093853 RepID=UPI0036D3A327
MAKILVVDDDVDIRALVENRLRRLGHRVVSAGSGEEALTVLAEKGAPDVVVLDVLMPGISGLELLTTIRQDPDLADVPAVFLSGRVLETDIEAGRALGATYLTKPVVLSALATTIDKVLELEAVGTGTW